MSILEAFLAGKEARRVADAQEQINAMQSFIGQNGQAIMAGDQNALGQLAGYGVAGLQAAMGVQDNLDVRQDRAEDRAIRTEDRQFRLEDREEAKAEAKRVAAEALAEKSAELTKEKLAAEREFLSGVLAGAAPLYKSGDKNAYNAFLASKGIDPNQYRFEDFEGNAVMVEGTLEAITEAQEAFSSGLDPDKRYKVVDDRLVDMAAAGGPAAVDIGGAPPKVDFDKVTDLRKEWTKLPGVLAFQAQSDALGRIVASAKDPSAAGDMALLYGYMKLLDPGSVVRETEFATAAASGSLPEQIQGYATKLLNGQRLTADQRADFLARATAIYKNAEAEYDNVRGQYTAIAERNGFPVNDALPDYRYSGQRTVGDDPGSPPPVTDQAEIDRLLRGPQPTP
jgi:hypothetical protein